MENLLDILDQKDNYNLADLEEIIELERGFDVIMQNLIKERDSQLVEGRFQTIFFGISLTT